MTVSVTIDGALEALSGAFERVGVPLWRPPKALAALEALEAELAPLRLPEAVRKFWRRVDVRTLRASPYPGFTTPEFALGGWRLARDEFRVFQPLALLNVGYESHGCMSVELDVGDVDGGALFEWFVSDPSGFERRFDGLAEWVRHIADLIDRGGYKRLETDHGPWSLVPDPDVAEEHWVAPSVPGWHPAHGTMLHVGGDILEWPEHWQRVNGLRPQDRRLRGATHTVSEVLVSRPDQALRATIAGHVVSFAGSGAWAHVRIADGTGELDIACPAGTLLLGPRLGRWFEFDVVVAPGVRRAAAAPDAAVAGIEDPVEQVAAVLMARHGGPAGANAEAIRRMPAPPR